MRMHRTLFSSRISRHLLTSSVSDLIFWNVFEIGKLQLSFSVPNKFDLKAIKVLRDHNLWNREKLRSILIDEMVSSYIQKHVVLHFKGIFICKKILSHSCHSRAKSTYDIMVARKEKETIRSSIHCYNQPLGRNFSSPLVVSMLLAGSTSKL